MRLRSDPELLSLVWNNLISNVRVNTWRGTIGVTLKTEELCGRIRPGYGLRHQTGSGPAHFREIYQGDTPMPPRETGLGLALVKRVWSSLNGEIGVQSTCGQGSTFTVKIRRGSMKQFQLPCPLAGLEECRFLCPAVAGHGGSPFLGQAVLHPGVGTNPHCRRLRGGADRVFEGRRKPAARLSPTPSPGHILITCTRSPEPSGKTKSWLQRHPKVEALLKNKREFKIFAGAVFYS